MAIADSSLLEHLEPIARLSAGRRKELAALCFIERVNQDIDPMRMNMAKAAQSMYLVKGDLGLRYDDGRKVRLRGGTQVTKHPVNADAKIKDTIALTDIEILRIDMDLLDIMMTWDQLSNIDSPAKIAQPIVNAKATRSVGDWMNETGVFSAFNLQNGIFSRLPAANVEQMFKRMTSMTVTAGQAIIQQGGAGDYYYLIQSGCAQVTRIVNASQPALILAELNDGSAFGEEALVSDNKRNATVTMKTDGELLRLNKKDFIELLKEPLINQVSRAEAEAKVANGAVWADVRLPSEFSFDHIQGAINIPLNQIRKLASELDKNRAYVLHCQTGRRSLAAAFILAQHGFEVVVLNGGTRASGL